MKAGKVCAVPGCGRGISARGYSGVCRDHNHTKGYCGCSRCLPYAIGAKPIPRPQERPAPPPVAPPAPIPAAAPPYHSPARRLPAARALAEGYPRMTNEKAKRLETHAAIYRAAGNPDLRRETSRALLSVLPPPKGGGAWPDPSWPSMPSMARALEIVLCRVKVYDRARGDLMTALLLARRNASVEVE